MRRRGLLIVLWLVGTTLATGVVFQAVKVMTDGLTDRSNQAGRPGPPAARRTTTTAAGKSVSSITVKSTTTASAATTAPATTEAVTTEAPVPSTEAPEAEGTAQGPDTVTRTPTRTTTSPSVTSGGGNGRGGTAPPPTSPPIVPSPPTNPPTVPTTQSTPPPTQPPTTAPAVVDDCKERAQMQAGPNRLSVKRCTKSDPPYDIYARDPKWLLGFGYSADPVQPGPGVVEVVFRGPSTYTCTAGPDGSGAWGSGCVQS